MPWPDEAPTSMVSYNSPNNRVRYAQLYSHFIDVKTEALEVCSFVQQTPSAVLCAGNITVGEETRPLFSWSREWLEVRQQTSKYRNWMI